MRANLLRGLLQDYTEFQVRDLRKEGADALKAGAEVVVSLDPRGVLRVLVPGGSEVGLVPSEKYCEIPKHASRGSVRSIRRNPEGKVHQVLIRVTTSRPAGQQAKPNGSQERGLRVAPFVPEVLTEDRLKLLAESEEIRSTLRDTRLQTLVASIEGDPDREQALRQALEGPEFRAFADSVLASVFATPASSRAR